ncbi:MAG: hypothetical protein IKW01_05215 [Firmicutes bacterium]|nr:hypothetical protein [Bacillota bacterium]
MLYFFYYTRNILGLIMVISPLAGFLFIDFNFSLFMVFLLGAVLGAAAGPWLCSLINFRLWTTAVVIIFSVAANLRITLQDCPEEYICFAILGFASSLLAVTVPANIVTGWFRSSKIQILGFVWGLSLPLGILLSFIMERFTYSAGAICTIIMIAGAAFFLQEPLHLIKQRKLTGKFLNICHQHVNHRRNAAKAAFFAGSISFSLGIGLLSAQSYLPPSTADFFLLPRDIFIMGLCAGSVASAFISGFKGIYGGAITVIFLAEISAVCSWQTCLPALYGSTFAAGMCAGALPIIIPVLTYFLCGPVNYNMSVCRITAVTAGGLLMAFVIFDGWDDSTFSFVPLLTAIGLLIFAFFTVFSAWNHRLFLLKCS